MRRPATNKILSANVELHGFRASIVSVSIFFSATATDDVSQLTMGAWGALARVGGWLVGSLAVWLFTMAKNGSWPCFVQVSLCESRPRPDLGPFFVSLS